MKTSLEHLPLRKRRDLQQTVDILPEELDGKIALAPQRSHRTPPFRVAEKAYVEARYSKHYKITAEELEWLAGCVEEMITVVDEACQGGIDGGGYHAPMNVCLDP